MAVAKTNRTLSAVTELAAYLLPIPFGYWLWLHVAQSLAPFNGPVRQQCRDAAYLASTYGAPEFLPSLLNRIVCVLVRFCSHAINDARPLTLTVLSAATSAYVIMSIESARHGGRLGLGLYTCLMIIGGDVIGTGIVIPLLWVPMYGVYKALYKQQVVHTTRVFGIAAAALVGQCIPPALMLAIPARSLWQHNVIAAFQYFPLVYSALECAVPWIASWCIQEQHLRIQYWSHHSVRRLWISLGTLFTFMHCVLLVQYCGRWNDCWHDDPITYMLFLDITGIVVTMAYWAGLQDGLRRGTLFVLSTSLILGPGAGLAAYAWRREGRIIQQQLQKSQ